MKSLKRIAPVFLALLFALILAAPLCAAAPDEQREELLQLQAYLLWQRINEVRRAPASYLDKLGISREQARVSLGQQAWVLDQGLPPLAWSDQLSDSAWNHGRDMFDRFYYGKVTPEGMTVAERIPQTGYLAAAQAESLGGIVFSSYVKVQDAVGYLLENLLRDELTGSAAGEINILSPRYTELGIGFFAEDIPFVFGEDYIYLAVFDFARPQEMRNFLILRTDVDDRPAVFPMVTSNKGDLGGLSLQLFSGELSQVAYPLSGGFAATRNSLYQLMNITYLPPGVTKNRWLDLRNQKAVELQGLE